MLNKVVLIGRLTKDPELRHTPNGNATCSFTLACDRQFKNAQGEKETDFLNVSVPLFKKELAELCANYLSKGKMAAVDGSIRVRTYEKDGQKHWITEVEAIDVRFLSPRDDSAGAPTRSPQPRTQAQTTPPYSPPPYGAPPQQNYQQPPYQQPPGAPSYPGQFAPPGYTPQQQSQGYGQPPQGQWQAPPQGQQPPPPGYGTPAHPNMPNPNFPPQQQSQQQQPPWLGQPQQNAHGASQTNLSQIGREVSLDDDIPF